MPRANADTHQVATRVSAEAWETLNVGLVAERATSMQELLRPVVEHYAEELRKEPEIQKILAEVEKYQGRKHGLRRLPNKGNGATGRGSAKKKPS